MLVIIAVDEVGVEEVIVFGTLITVLREARG
jgi:hypothetical protein